MKTNREKYQELVRDTLQHLSETYTSDSFFLTGEDNVLFFSSSIRTAQSSPVAENPPLIPVSHPVMQRKKAKEPVSENSPSLQQKDEGSSNKKKEEDRFRISSSLSHTKMEMLGFEAMQQQVQKKFPTFKIKKEIPDDHCALQLANQWKENALEAEVAILSFHESKQSDLFLQNIQKAISLYFFSAQIIDVDLWDKQKKWELFFEHSKTRWILSSPSLLKKSSLLPFYREIPATSERFLGPFRLHILEEIESYLKNPSLKKTLWQSLCALLRLPNTPASS
jgi:hypothetical protein